MQKKMQVYRFFFRIFNYIFLALDFFCAFLEMHLVKIVSFSIMALCCSMEVRNSNFITTSNSIRQYPRFAKCQRVFNNTTQTNVNALHLIIVIMLLFFLIFGISALRFSFSFIGLYLGVLFLCKMAYQTKFFPKMETSLNCSKSNATLQSVLSNTILDPVWWGFEVVEGTLTSYYKGYILVFAVMTMRTVICTRQKIARIDAREPPNTPHVLFIKTTRKDADKSLRECFKYLINYGFYKFGIEVTLSFCVILIAIRKDVFSLIYTFWLFILFLPKRSTLFLMWPFFLTTLLFSVLWQYTMAVSISSRACFFYPWTHQENLIVWFFLPDFDYKPDTKKTLVDFVLLLLIQRQQSVFELEREYGDRYLGGSNSEVYKIFDNPNLPNPTPNHTLNFKSPMNLIKYLFLSSFYRLTLAFLFWNGASNMNVLSLGYLIAAFMFFWIEFELYLWPIKKIQRWWNTLLGFVICIIFIKTVIECVGCVFEDYFKNNLHWLVTLLCINCQCKGKSNSDLKNPFFLDVICFICVIFQRRFFRSYYFLHEKNDILGIYTLQEKGAKLIDKMQEYKLKKFQEEERKTLLKIKKNMTRIKAWQKRMQGLNYIEPRDHATATYMGDYFMFQDLDDKAPVKDESSSSSEENEPKSSRMSTKVRVKEGGVKKRSNEKSRSEIKKQPSRSEDTDTDSKNTERDDGKEKSVKKKFIVALNKTMIFLTRLLQKFSRDYHYFKLEMNRKRKKQKFRAEQAQQNIARYPGKDSKDDDDDDEEEQEQDEEVYYYYYDRKKERMKKDERSFLEAPNKIFLNLLISFSMFIMSKTELLCYIIIFVRTTLSPSLLTLPVPLLVFLWGSLTNVRPTKTFWTVLLAYIEVAMVIKAIFQNSIFPWNKSEKKINDSPKNAPLFIGIHQNEFKYVIADLFLLLFLFLHRNELKTLGLWNRAHEEETLVPQNLHVYKELPTEEELKQMKGNRSAVYLRKVLMSDPLEKSPLEYLKIAIWKCCSRATAKFTYRGNKKVTHIRIKEIEGKTLVTHEGRRLEPTFLHVSRIPDDELEGAVILRVYMNEIHEAKALPHRLSWIQYFTPLRKFFLQILVRDWRVSGDFYTPMFIFEFLNFLIVFFGYSSFSNPTLVTDDYFNLLENQVPIMYLFTVIAHFLIIVIDRVLYLRKSVIGKLVFQLILVILVHMWMFILIPIVTESSFNNLPVPQTYYAIACFYFLMSAYQLRVGYPLRVQGHFLCRKYGYFNYYAYKGLQFIPFFNQLRTLLDYICTHSSLTMTEWIKMESIFEIIFENKCSRRADIYYPSARGEECPKCSKYCPGIATLSGSIIVIWLPFIIFALFNSVAKSNLPQEAHLEIQIQNFGEIYNAKARFNDIYPFREKQYGKLLSKYKNNRKAWMFLNLYSSRDVGVIKFKSELFHPWIITPTQFEMLNQTLQNLDNPIKFYVLYTIQRYPQAQIVSTGKGYSEITLVKSDKARKILAEIFLGRKGSLLLKNALPKYIHVTNLGKAIPISTFSSSQDHTTSLRSLNLTLIKHFPYMWWKVQEIPPDDDEDADPILEDDFGTKDIIIYTFNEKNVPTFLQNVKRKGIIGLYISIVIFTWSFIRRLMRKYPFIMFTDMPNPDPVLKLCQDIYLARESHEFALEEDLYAKLLFLFRSPETLVKVTRLEPNIQRP